MTAKQRVVLGAVRDAQHERDGDAVSAGRVADVCPAPWHGRPDLVTAALVLLERDGMVLAAAGLDAGVEDHRGRPADAPAAPRARAPAPWHRRRPDRALRRGQPQQPGQPLSWLFSAAAAENFAARLAAIWIDSPVAGLRPSRAARSAMLNFPKAAIATSRPAASSPAIVSKTASTAFLACSPASPAAAATCLASSV